MANPPKKPRSFLEVPIENPQGIKAVYANHFGVSATMTDVTIYFLEVGQTPGGKAGNAAFQEVKAIVTVPPILAQAMIQALQQAIVQQATGLQTALKQQQQQMMAAQQANGGKK